MSDDTRTQVPSPLPPDGSEPDLFGETVTKATAHAGSTREGNSTRDGTSDSDPRTVVRGSGAGSLETTGGLPVAARSAGGGVPGYEILGELGRGAMGVVYKARAVKLNRLVALKMALGGRVGEKDLIRFLAEAQSVAAVRHENVVQVYDYGDADGHPFMALEFCPGGSLADRLRDEDEGALDPAGAAELLARIAAGVAAAHEAGIVHRDLKPGNVLLDSDGEPKVADFGLAKRGASELTATQAVMGTPSYMSPEQAAGKTKFVGPQADVWALGVMLYEMLTGARPFVADTQLELMIKIGVEAPVPPRKVLPSVPRDLDLICRKCLEKNPGDRYPTARELADDLDRFARGEPITARPLGAVPRALRWARRNPVVAGLLAAVGLVTLGLVGSLYAQYQQALTQAGAEREAKVVAERAREQEEIARKNAERATEETKRREEAERQKIEAQRQKAEAELVAARTAAEAAQANALVGLLKDMFTSSDPLAQFFGEAPPVLGAAGASEGQAAVLGPFLRNAAARFRNTLSATDPAAAVVRAKLLAAVGNGMKNLGLYSEARVILEEALALRRTHLPETHPDVWRSEQDLALVEAEGGDLLRGIDRFRKVIELQKKAGADPADVLTAKLYEGIALTTTGLAEAGPVLKEVVREREKLLGPGHKDTLFAKLGLIAWYLEHKDDAELAKLFGDIRTHLLAVPDADARAVFEAILNAQAKLVMAHAAKELEGLVPGSRRRAVTGLRDDLARLEKVLPEDHLIVIIFRFELGKLLADLGEGAAADELFARVLAGTRKTVGLAHPKFLVFLQTYTWRLANSKRLADARALFEEAEKANRARFGDANPWLTVILLQRAEMEREFDAPDKAKALATAAVGLMKQGKFLPTQGALSDLFDAATALGTHVTTRPAARELFVALRPLVETVHGPNSAEMVTVLIAEGKQAYDANTRALAAPAFERALKIVTDHPAVARANRFAHTDALHWSGKIELDRGRPAEAEALFRATRAAAQGVSGYKVSTRAEDAELLARAVSAQGKFADAVSLFEEARKLRASLKPSEAGAAWSDYEVATAQLAAGDRAGYLKSVEKMFKQYGKTTDTTLLSRLAWAGALSARPEGWAPAAFEAQYATAYKSVTNFAWGFEGLALVRLRAGKLAEAEDALTKVGATVHPLDHLIRGLIAVARKDLPRARLSLASAERLIEAQKPTPQRPYAYAGRFWHKDVEVAVLLAELRAAVAPAVAPPPRAK